MAVSYEGSHQVRSGMWIEDSESFICTGEFPRQMTLVRADQFHHGDLTVIVAEAAGHAAEEGEGPRVVLLKGLRAFPREPGRNSGLKRSAADRLPDTLVST